MEKDFLGSTEIRNAFPGINTMFSAIICLQGEPGMKGEFYSVNFGQKINSDRFDIEYADRNEVTPVVHKSGDTILSPQITQSDLKIQAPALPVQSGLQQHLFPGSMRFQDGALPIVGKGPEPAVFFDVTQCGTNMEIRPQSIGIAESDKEYQMVGFFRLPDIMAGFTKQIRHPGLPAERCREIVSDFGIPGIE